MSETEFIHLDTGIETILIPKKKKKKQKQLGIDQFIEKIYKTVPEFNIPIFYVGKLEYVAVKDLYELEGLKKGIATYRLSKMNLIYELKYIPRRLYVKTWKSLVKLDFTMKGRPLIIISVQDAILFMSKARNDEKKDKIIRKLVISLTKVVEDNKLFKNENCMAWYQAMLMMDKVLDRFVNDKWENYVKIPKNLWNLAHFINYSWRRALGEKLPDFKLTVLHHEERPYSKIYAHICSKGEITLKKEHRKGQLYS